MSSNTTVWCHGRVVGSWPWFWFPELQHQWNISAKQCIYTIFPLSLVLLFSTGAVRLSLKANVCPFYFQNHINKVFLNFIKVIPTVVRDTVLWTYFHNSAGSPFRHHFFRLFFACTKVTKCIWIICCFYNSLHLYSSLHMPEACMLVKENQILQRGSNCFYSVQLHSQVCSVVYLTVSHRLS